MVSVFSAAEESSVVVDSSVQKAMDWRAAFKIGLTSVSDSTFNEVGASNELKPEESVSVLFACGAASKVLEAVQAQLKKVGPAGVIVVKCRSIRVNGRLQSDVQAIVDGLSAEGLVWVDHLIEVRKLTSADRKDATDQTASINVHSDVLIFRRESADKSTKTVPADKVEQVLKEDRAILGLDH